MPRKLKPPCEYCDCGFDDWLGIESDAGADLTLEIYPGHCISASAILYNPRTEETHEASVSIPMNFCPVCGRKWSE